MFPFLQANIPTIMQMVEQIHGAKEQLLQLWHAKKIKLDQCFQLRHFEQDCKKVWREREMLLRNVATHIFPKNFSISVEGGEGYACTRPYASAEEFFREKLFF